MDIEDFLHKTPADVDPKAGQLLISDPMMADPHFCRTVVLILDREPDGSHLGLVLNRELDLDATTLFPDWPGAERLPLYNGGPVELGRLFMLHRLGDTIHGSTELVPGLYTGGDVKDIKKFVGMHRDADRYIRFYLGYSGWSGEQLTTEILQNSWAVNTHPDMAALFVGSGMDYWRKEVERLGPGYRSWLNIPIHPSLN